MDWFETLFTSTGSVAHIVLLYALVIAIGVFLGKIKVGSISLGVTFVLFAGIIVGAEYVYFISYKGLKSKEINAFKDELAKCDAQCHVLKNRLINKVAEKNGMTALAETRLTGDTAVVVGKGEHLHGQYGGVHCAVYPDRCDGYAGRHLYYAEHRVKAVEHAFDGHADDGQRGRRRYYARQGGSHAGAGYYHLNAAGLGSACELFYCVGRAVCREGVDLERNLHVVEEPACLFHYGQVACAAHDYAN